MMAGLSRRTLLSSLFLLVVLVGNANAKASDKHVVTYDARSLIINGSRELLFSGSVHYPRSTPEMWPDIIKKAKEGGLNVIQTYVFWNVHEPVEGQFNFEGNLDLIKFIKLIGDNGMWVTLRVGPFIAAEWKMGGLPFWLREKKGISFRSDNEIFKYHMKKYTEKIIKMVKKAKLFADQGGPVILGQIENEYTSVQRAYGEKGDSYIQWAASMAIEQYNGVPWIMCKQKNAPPQVISACNGRQCGDTFEGAGPNKPFLWTENWTAQFRVFGDEPGQRAAEDLAYAVARFFARNGTLNNYYMFHGGTNFGRTTSSFVTTRYYDEAPLDEFGLKREPKFGHLRDLHRAIRLSKKPLLWGTPRVQKISRDLEITTFEKPGEKFCAAFLTNNNTRDAATINFRGVNYYLPRKSISILPDCKTVVYNTKAVVAQHSSRNFVVSKKAKPTKWVKFTESIPTMDKLAVKSNIPKELFSFTRDITDYAWYSTSIEIDPYEDLPMRPDVRPVLVVRSNGHGLLGFVNGEYVGFDHSSNDEHRHVFRKTITLKPGINQITLLAMTVGYPHSSANLEKRWAGPSAVLIDGLMSGTIDITRNNWAQEIGVTGEKLQLFTEEGSKKVKWAPVAGPQGPVTWYKTYFDAPEGDDRVAIRMASMSKGMVWVNGHSLGRYWVSFLADNGKPTQVEYHIPRGFLKAKKNLVVVFEETGGNPDGIEILTVNRNTICSVITEFYPPNVRSWERKDNKFRAMADPVKAAQLTCPEDKVISKVEFVSFGESMGACGSFTPGRCDSRKARKVVEEECLGKRGCSIPFERERFVDADKDACPDKAKTLAIQVACAKK